MKRMSSGSLSGLLGLALTVMAIGRMNAQETQTAPSAAPWKSLCQPHHRMHPSR